MFHPVRRLLSHHRERLMLAAVLLLSSAASLALLAFRFYYSGTAGYAGMVWNLFLAWIPLWLALGIGALRGAGRGATGALLALGFVWLLFFPNAPYLLSEFIHLSPEHAIYQRPVAALAAVSPGRVVPVWFDAGMILSFAWTGLLLAFVSLHLVQHAVRERFGDAWGWATVVVVLWLGGFGVSIGRFQRWNSWDLFSQPITLLADVTSRLLNPIAHPQTTAVTVLFWSFLMLAYLSVVAMASLRPAPSRIVRVHAAG
jgi:uncharacterized membrane protein